MGAEIGGARVAIVVLAGINLAVMSPPVTVIHLNRNLGTVLDSPMKSW